MLDFIKPGKPTHNTFIERFNRTYLTEILDFYLFRTLNEVREITERWLHEYNSKQPHESLNNLTPEEYRLMAENPEISKNVWNQSGCAYSMSAKRCCCDNACVERFFHSLKLNVSTASTLPVGKR